MSPARRRRLQQLFEHGSNATEAEQLRLCLEFARPVRGGRPGQSASTPGNILDNLTRLYDNNPKNVSKLSSIKAAGSKPADELGPQEGLARR